VDYSSSSRNGFQAAAGMVLQQQEWFSSNSSQSEIIPAEQHRTMPYR
jgi:hypothetical protein